MVDLVFVLRICFSWVLWFDVCWFLMVVFILFSLVLLDGCGLVYMVVVAGLLTILGLCLRLN